MKESDDVFEEFCEKWKTLSLRLTEATFLLMKLDRETPDRELTGLHLAPMWDGETDAAIEELDAELTPCEGEMN